MAMAPESLERSAWVKLAVCAAVGFSFRVLGPPSNLPPDAWHILGVFLAVIIGFLLRPLPMGPLVLLGLVVLSADGTVTLEEALSGYGDTTVWLVVAAFLIAGGVVRTGFGRRIALSLVVKLGRSMLGLGYSLCGAELLLGPIVPSNTARGGGILAPIARSLCEALDSHPDTSPQRAGSYLCQVGAHANLIAAAAFMTGMAANPLVSKAARDVFGIDFGWTTWALGSLVPALVGMALLPLVLFRLEKPSLVETLPAQQRAREELKKMGPWTPEQKAMAAVFAILILLWTTKGVHGMGTSLVAWIGVCLLFLSRAAPWKTMIRNEQAWDTLIWLGGLLAMANALKNHGFVDWFAQEMGHSLGGFKGLAVVAVLALVYFYSMYAFSMLTAHISALATAFFAVALAAGAPPFLTVALLAYFSNLCGCTTNYSSGPIIVYFGLGYVPSNRWFGVGFAVSLFHLAVWFGVGLPWWKLLGWW